MSRLQKTRQPLNLLDVSRSPTASSTASSLDPALSTLSQEDAEVLEAIISKVPDATAFMTVFKAYSEVLQNRGLDPGNDVIYYKQLLKLGVIKGADWGAKWRFVKGQLGLDVHGATNKRPNGRVGSAKLTGLSRSSFDEDAFTLHSHADETETAVDPLHRLVRPSGRPFNVGLALRADTTESRDLSSDLEISLTPPQRSFPIRQLLSLPIRPTPPSPISESIEAPIRSSTPPLLRFRKNQTYSPVPQATTTTRSSHEQITGGINDAEAWRKVEQARQLEDAIRFRRESLLSMCFRTWLGGLDWIHNTHSQIDNARNHIQLRCYFSRWITKASGLREIAERATQVARLNTQTAVLDFWKERARRRRILKWREEMRSKMLHLKRKYDERICVYAWTNWRQLHISRQLYTRNTLLRTFHCWRTKLREIDTLESLAERFEETQARRTLESVMEFWSRRVQMRDAEKYLAGKISYRIMALAFETWIHILQDNHCADAHQTRKVMKSVFGTWQRAKEHIRVLDSRCDKHLKRRNNLLLRAIIRVWIARERGHLLDRVQNARLRKEAFLVWWRRFQEQKLLAERAVTHSNRANSLLLSSVFEAWTKRRTFLRSNLILVDRHYASSLLSRVLLIWRLRYHAEQKLVRKASMAKKYFVERATWDAWRRMVEKKKRIRKIQDLERVRLKRVFFGWLDIVRRRRHQEQLIKAYQKRTRRRLLRKVVQCWTDRVVFIKLREIDTTEQRDKETIGIAFVKWKDMCLRHVENLSLVNSFQDVKREDTLRRMFIKWLTAARKSKTRRTRLAEREHELRLDILAAAWEAWRDRFRENRLQNLEYHTIIQSQSNILYRAFTTWQARCKSLPSIRLYASSLRAKTWFLWRAAMPLAVQARKSREMHAQRILSMVFDKWKEAHRSKIALKAVARARYLRLPSPGYKSSASGPQSHDTLHLRPLLHRPLRSQISATAVATNAVSNKDQNTTVPEPVPSRKRAFSSLLASRPGLRLYAASTENIVHTAQVPPSAGDTRDRLWNELRGTRLYGLYDDRAKSR